MRSADELDRLALYVPELTRHASPDAQAYALAYVERYQGDVLQLEQEWDFLAAALGQAWQASAYPAVVALVAGLAHVAGRRSNLAEAEHLLRLGIEASRQTGDGAHLAAFSNRLSGLLLARGKYEEGWRLWNSSLESDAIADACPLFWEPISSFAYIADAYLMYMLGAQAAAPRFVQAIQSACAGEQPERFVVALFVRGFYARLTNDLDNAYADLSICLRSLTLQASGVASPQRQLFTLAAQAELARARGDYARSQSYTETALALARVFSDPYTVTALLIDQGLYTYHQGQVADMRTCAQRLRELACQMEAPRAHYYSSLLEKYLAELASDCSGAASTALVRVPAVAALPEPISEREREVLRLVALGLSNQQIARRLVITPGTVKKHLEHIYTKLDVHSRTAALARARSLDLVG